MRMSAGAPAPPVRRVRVMAIERWRAPTADTRARRIVAVGSAQAGAGKSVVAANLAAALAALGQKVVLVDFDPLTPRQHDLLGLSPPPRALETWLEERREGRDAVPVATRVRNLRLLPYRGADAAGVAGRRAVSEALHTLEADVVVVDIGADNREDLFDFFATGAVRLLVSSGDQSGLEASYAFLKSAVLRAERRHGGSARAVLERFSGALVGNGTADSEEAERFHAFSRLALAELGIPLPALGCLQTSPRIPQSIVARQPLVAGRGNDDNVRTFHHLAEWVLAGTAAPARSCPLDGPPIVVAPGPLPAALSLYERKHPRFTVDWTATLELPAGATAIRVRDVSASGAGIDTALTLRVGDRGVIHFDQLRGQAPLAVVVKNVLPALRRVGLGFSERGPDTERLVAAARSAAGG
jgi:MinD-like ATPase involved in chromosome partitioning or flagellar assembly